MEEYVRRDHAPAGDGKPGYWYVVVVLALGYAANFLDRQVINILGQSIKEDMGISDAQLGLLTGTAFGIFYSVLGLPIARLADRVNRVNLISAALLVWSGFTALCGLSQSYVQLFAARLGVGVGEAGGTPPSQSLISDCVPPAKRTLAFSLFNLGIPIGSFLGFLLGGYINDWFGWRVAFLLAGVPGLLVALLVKTTIREPIRGALDAAQAQAAEMPPLRATLKQLFGLRSYLALIVGSTFGIFIIYITGAWLPPMFIRVHGFSAHEIGQWMALCAGLGGAIGALVSGWFASALRKRWRNGDLWLVIAGSAATTPMFLITVLSNHVPIALTAMFFLFAFSYFWMGPTSARIQQVVPIRSRALAVGFMIFQSSITALAFGPPLVGWMSDVLAPEYGVHSLRIALAVASIAGLCDAFTYLIAVRNIDRDLARGNVPEQAPGAAEQGLARS
jgi:MFS family permease